MCVRIRLFVTLAGANLLAKGDMGLSAALVPAVRAKNRVLEVIDGLEGIELAFPNTPALNEITSLLLCFQSNQFLEEPIFTLESKYPNEFPRIIIFL